MHEILAKHSLYVCLKVLLSSYSIFWSAVNLEGNGRCFEFLYTNTHPGKEKTVTTGILYYIRICNPWPNMNTLCKFCELLQKKKHFFFFLEGGGNFENDVSLMKDVIDLLRPQTWPILWSPQVHPQFLFPAEIIRNQ